MPVGVAKHVFGMGTREGNNAAAGFQVPSDSTYDSPRLVDTTIAGGRDLRESGFLGLAFAAFAEGWGSDVAFRCEVGFVSQSAIMRCLFLCPV